MKKLLILALVMFAPLCARAELHALTWSLPVVGVDNTTLAAGAVKAVRIQCAPGTTTAGVLNWPINEDVPAATLTKAYDFANGPWVCRSQAIGADSYYCAFIMDSANNRWSFDPTTGDQYGRTILQNGSANAGAGSGTKLVLTGGKIWASAGIPPTDPVTWWRYDTGTSWSGPLAAPTISASDPQITPTTQCLSGYTPDLVFSVPLATWTIGVKMMPPGSLTIQ